MRTRLLKRLRSKALKRYILWLSTDGCWIVSDNEDGRVCIKTNSYNYSSYTHQRLMRTWICARVYMMRYKSDTFRTIKHRHEAGTNKRN